jgi:hypothetical protein
MKLMRSLILLFISILLIYGCSLKTTSRQLGTVGNGLIPVDFVKEGSRSPELDIADKYVYEIREKGVLLGSFSKDDSKTESYRITIFLEPRDYEIQLCQGEKVIIIVNVNSTKTQEVHYNPSAFDGFMEAGGKYLMVPVLVVTWPVWGPIMYFQHKQNTTHNK